MAEAVVEALMGLRVELNEKQVPREGRCIRVSERFAHNLLCWHNRVSGDKNPVKRVTKIRAFGFDVVEVGGDEAVVFLEDYYGKAKEKNVARIDA